MLFLETLRNLIKLTREKVFTKKDYAKLRDRVIADKELFSIKNVDADICFDDHFPAVSLPKSLDLIHIRTALWFQENDQPLQFLTLDVSQRQSAKEMGLEIIEL